MIRLNCDYSEGAHPAILEALSSTNMEQTPGYGEDIHCENAARMFKELCGAPNAQIHFLVGGTQANLTLISAALRPHQGVLCAGTGHINVHETGAIEACGHKVLPLPGTEGKLTGRQVREAVAAHFSDGAHEHMVQPGMVYLSDSTELGTIYQREELEDISAACRENGLFLYLDGARLGYALAAQGNDLTLPDLARLCDALTIGGTKQGALFGEAMIISSPMLGKDFRYLIKQKGGMLAKGRLLGVQFEALFQDGLYFSLAQRANELAMTLKDSFCRHGFPFLTDSPTNQQFVILPDKLLKALEEKYAFSYERRMDGEHSAVRFCTSWATKEEDIRSFLADLDALCRA